MAAPLSFEQKMMLAALKHHGGSWHVDCGWSLGANTNLTAVLETLTKRGLVTRIVAPDGKTKYLLAPHT